MSDHTVPLLEYFMKNNAQKSIIRTRKKAFNLKSKDLIVVLSFVFSSEYSFKQENITNDGIPDPVFRDYPEYPPSSYTRWRNHLFLALGICRSIVPLQIRQMEPRSGELFFHLNNDRCQFCSGLRASIICRLGN